MIDIIYKPIGIIHSKFKEQKGMPIQPSAAKDIEGTVEVFPKYEKGLKDIEGFSHIILIYHFHLSKSYSLEVVPFMDNKLHGIFTTRAPSRPNTVGISIVRLIKAKKNILYIKDVDIVDGTPLLNIKPFVSEFDNPKVINRGWLEKNISKLPRFKDNGRFSK
ncbi:MAG: tRNA (N6-threonylcarbamoyladenosine(37)-N6)-methyltransferase TrmO [Actinobacteria bacterium]|nr:tRNA (N6-threonylcarbamoyladenosine(37)-N6)-methyltransferase TrmO [Actinomycetota bacterium]